MTDEFAVDKYLSRRLGYDQQKIKHKKHQDVNADINPNTIENFWGSLFDQMISLVSKN